MDKHVGHKLHNCVKQNPNRSLIHAVARDELIWINVHVKQTVSPSQSHTTSSQRQSKVCHAQNHRTTEPICACMHKHISKARGSVTKTKTHKDAQAYLQSARLRYQNPNPYRCTTISPKREAPLPKPKPIMAHKHISKARGSVTNTNTHKYAQPYLQNARLRYQNPNP